MESVVNTQITRYIDMHGLLSPHQFGFRKGLSTEQMLLLIVNRVLGKMDTKQPQYISLLSLDIRKAFDTVNHHILLKKLETLFLFSDSSLKLIKSYLTDRVQKVKVGYSVSQANSIVQGVPQGSVLGPLLFNIMVNDMLTQHKCAISYADDTTLVIPSSNIKSALTNTEQHFNKIHNWFTHNGFLLNIPKSTCMIISNRTVPSNLTVLLSGSRLKVGDSLALVGVTLDPKLSFVKQSRKSKSVVSSLLYSLKKIRHFLTTSEALKIYESIIRPKLEYCSALTLGTSLENVQLLEACQSRAIRIICRAPFSHTNSFSVSTARIFLELPLLSERRSEHFLKIVQNVIDGKGSSALLSSLSECKSRTRGLRNSCQWILPNPVTNHGRRRFVFQAIRVLKSLSLV